MCKEIGLNRELKGEAELDIADSIMSYVFLAKKILDEREEFL